MRFFAPRAYRCDRSDGMGHPTRCRVHRYFAVLEQGRRRHLASPVAPSGPPAAAAAAERRPRRRARQHVPVHGNGVLRRPRVGLIRKGDARPRPSYSAQLRDICSPWSSVGSFYWRGRAILCFIFFYILPPSHQKRLLAAITRSSTSNHYHHPVRYHSFRQTTQRAVQSGKRPVAVSRSRMIN